MNAFGIILFFEFQKFEKHFIACAEILIIIIKSISETLDYWV